MPLWKLQTIGPERVGFLYENVGAGRVIELRPGVAYCFRKFHPLIADQVDLQRAGDTRQAVPAWVTDVR